MSEYHGEQATTNTDVAAVISGVVASYVGAKFIYTTMFRGTDRLTSNSKRTWAIWVCICISIWTAGWLIAELIPVRRLRLF